MVSVSSLLFFLIIPCPCSLFLPLYPLPPPLERFHVGAAGPEMKAELIALNSFVLYLWWISRQGDPLGADVSDDEGGVGPPEEEDEFYPESNQWEAGEEEDEEEEATKPPPPPPAAAAITEKVA